MNKQSARDCSVAVYGEVLFDCFSDHRVLGGAPFNVAWALTGFGQTPSFFSSAGEDREGREIVDTMESWGMPISDVRLLKHMPTGRVLVTLEGGEPSYVIESPSAWDEITVGSAKGRSFQLIYHGSLALRNAANRQSLMDLCEKSGGVRFFDVNLREPYDSLGIVREWLHGADWVKLNLDELRRILERPEICFDEAEAFLRGLMLEFDIKNVVLTAGSQGALLLGDTGQLARAESKKPEIWVDAVGAGDAFAAVLIQGIIEGVEVTEMLENASFFASQVCGLRGAISNERSFYERNRCAG